MGFFDNFSFLNDLLLNINSKFIILHHFIKKTQKIPKREIEQAKKNLQDYLGRNK